MNPTFWHQKWETNEIGFHENEANPLLVRHFATLSVAEGGRVFLPLCGKTSAISWLLSHGYRVAGAELSAKAVQQLFVQLHLMPEISRVGSLLHYRAEGIDIFVGDIFDLTIEMLGAVDAIYDRAALVALPEAVRKCYANHLLKITNEAPQLLISYEYDQSVVEGPPFSVTRCEIHHHYGNTYRLNLLAGAVVPGGLKGKCAARESVWLLKNY